MHGSFRMPPSINLEIKLTHISQPLNMEHEIQISNGVGWIDSNLENFDQTLKKYTKYKKNQKYFKS